MEEVVGAAPQPARSSMDESVASARLLPQMKELTVSPSDLKISWPKIADSSRQDAAE